jgi:hypothetical protein
VPSVEPDEIDWLIATAAGIGALRWIVAALRIGADLAPQPWHVRIVPSAEVIACGIK